MKNFLDEEIHDRVTICHGHVFRLWNVCGSNTNIQGIREICLPSCKLNEHIFAHNVIQSLHGFILTTLDLVLMFNSAYYNNYIISVIEYSNYILLTTLSHFLYSSLLFFPLPCSLFRILPHSSLLSIAISCSILLYLTLQAVSLFLP